MRYPFMPRNVFKCVKRSREKICFLLENATRQIIKRDEWEGTSSFLGCRINYEPIEMHAYEYRVFNNHKDQKNLRTPLTGVYIYMYTPLSACLLLNGESELREIITIIRNARGARSPMLITFTTCVDK